MAEIKKKAEEADKVFLAPDPDREGEAIAWHLEQELLGKSKKKKKDGKIFRVLFNEITESAIKRALQSPGEIDMKLVNAQQARRVLDRIVGYQGSQLLWNKVRRGLSMGRVQSVAMRLICERERSGTRSDPEEYWSIIALLAEPIHRHSRRSFTVSMAKRRRLKMPSVAASSARSGKGIRRTIDRTPRKETESRRAVHYESVAARSLAEAALLAEENDDTGAAVV